MILSYHPLIVKDENRLCAGRLPDEDDLKAIRRADAVILPQGCHEPLYQMARSNCPNVFPNYDARFRFPGKSGQAHLFRNSGVPHPETAVFSGVSDFQHRSEFSRKTFPVVFKFDWGGEGENIFAIHTPAALTDMICKAELFEKTGQFGFVLQEFIPAGGCSLRVVIMGRKLLSYWRVSESESDFFSGISKGAKIKTDFHPALQKIGQEAVATFCMQTGINLAGFDILFRRNPSDDFSTTPLFLEINYFFGRKGLGGSEAYHVLLEAAVNDWVETLGA